MPLSLVTAYRSNLITAVARYHRYMYRVVGSRSRLPPTRYSWFTATLHHLPDLVNIMEVGMLPLDSPTVKSPPLNI